MPGFFFPDKILHWEILKIIMKNHNEKKKKDENEK